MMRKTLKDETTADRKPSTNRGYWGYVEVGEA
jgi:hypothetical protein